MTQTIALDSPEFAAAPRTIRELITATLEIGGQVVMSAERRFDFSLPCRVVGGKVKLVQRGTVGYFVQDDGRNRIKGAHALRANITYWAKQSRPV